MGNCQDTFETRKRSVISAFSICMTVPFRKNETGSKMKNPTNSFREMKHVLQLV